MFLLFMDFKLNFNFFQSKNISIIFFFPLKFSFVLFFIILRHSKCTFALKRTKHFKNKTKNV